MEFLLFDDQQIADAYARHVRKPPGYGERHRHLPMQLNTGRFRWEGRDVNRIYTVLDFREWAARHGLEHGERLLVTAPDDPELEHLRYREVVAAPYDAGRHDLHRLDLPAKGFDLAVISQTLEHLYQPGVALARVLDHLRPGGWFFTSVPTINIPHLVPYHFYGFTPTGLCLLLMSAGFEVVELGWSGSRQYVEHLFSTHTWPDYRDLLGPDGLLPASTERDACQTWALARRPAR